MLWASPWNYEVKVAEKRLHVVLLRSVYNKPIINTITFILKLVVTIYVFLSSHILKQNIYYVLNVVRLPPSGRSDGSQLRYPWFEFMYM